MISMYIVLILNVILFGSESQLNLRRHLLQIECCKDLGENCYCRQGCSGSDCTSNGGELCNTGVCCCGNVCSKPVLFGDDICPTDDPTTDPTADPTTDPSQDPTTDPTIDPTEDPTADPTSDPSKDPTTDPTTEPTIGCAKWSPETSSPTTDGSGGNNIPIPDFSGSPQLCQLGKSGSWNSLDQWYSFDCSCYDVQTLYKLTQFIAGWFIEFQLNNMDDAEEGRFESYFENYSTEDITFSTSLTTQSGTSNGPSWQDLEDLTSCDPDNPGYAELVRTLPYDFQVAPGGVSIRDCIENGNLIFAQVNIPNYRVRDNNFTENQVSFSYLTVERQTGTNIWLFKGIEFGGVTVGYLSQEEA